MADPVAMRIGAWALLLALAACGGDDDVPVVDAGSDGGGGFDAAVTLDAGGSDAGLTDAGVDAGGSADAGPLLPDFDAGNPFGDAGPLGPPEWAEIDVRIDGECPALTPCGGDVVGTWDVQGGCVAIPTPEQLSRCPGATFTGEGRTRGRVTFTDTTARRLGQTEVTMELFVPSFCATFAGGCESIERNVAMTGVETGCAEDAEANCICLLRVVNVIDDGDAYTLEGNQIVSTTSGKRWDYCIDGDDFRYRDVSADTSTREPGILDLVRR